MYIVHLQKHEQRYEVIHAAVMVKIHIKLVRHACFHPSPGCPIDVDSSVCPKPTLPLLCPITLVYVNLPYAKKTRITPHPADILQFYHSISGADPFNSILCHCYAKEMDSRLEAPPSILPIHALHGLVLFLFILLGNRYILAWPEGPFAQQCGDCRNHERTY